MAERPEFNPDFTDMIQALQEAGALFVIVGAHALAAHGIPRATGDFDIFVAPTQDNAARVLSGIDVFCASNRPAIAGPMTRSGSAPITGSAEPEHPRQVLDRPSSSHSLSVGAAWFMV